MLCCLKSLSLGILGYGPKGNWKRKIGKCFFPLGLHSVMLYPKRPGIFFIWHSLSDEDFVSFVLFYSVFSGVLALIRRVRHFHPALMLIRAYIRPFPLELYLGLRGPNLMLLTDLKWPLGAWRTRVATPKYPSRLYKLDPIFFFCMLPLCSIYLKQNNNKSNNNKLTDGKAQVALFWVRHFIF